MIRPGYFAAALSCSSRPRPGTPPDKFTVAAIPFRSISSIARGIASGARWECTSILVYREERQDSASSARMKTANRRRAAIDSGMADFTILKDFHENQFSELRFPVPDAPW